MGCTATTELTLTMRPERRGTISLAAARQP
jgi:hypothetical protein